MPKPIEALVDALAQLGWVEGRSLRIEYRWAEGISDRLPALAQDLVRSGVEVIVAAGDGATRAAMDATREIPIVMGTSGDAIGAGFVASLARPGGNVTGVTSIGPELSAKRLQLLRELRPDAVRIAVILKPGNAADALEWKETQKAAQAAGIRVQTIELRDPSEVAASLNAIRHASMDALIVSNTATEARQAIVSFAAAQRLPAMYEASEWVRAGGLMAYGVTHVDQFRQSATYVDRILKGARPADLPVSQPTIVRLTINSQAARALDLIIPQSLLLRADEVIQ